MNLPLVDYYSVSSRGYTKYPNVEVIGVENYSFNPKSLSERQMQEKSIIKEEDVEYESPEIKSSQDIAASSGLQPFSKARQMMEREEVNSIHLTTPKCNSQNPSLTHSLINTSQAQPKGILKRSLHELQKNNINSQQDFTCDKHLYLELQKQRKLRKDLQKTYKNLLTEVQRKERAYSADLNQEREEGRKRQFSKRTLNYQQQHCVQEYDDLQPPSSKAKKMSEVKTVKLAEFQKQRQQQQQQKQEQASEQSRSQNSAQIRKHLMTQQQSDYFQEQRQFQQRVLQQMRNLNKRITQIDQFLLEKEKEQEKQRLSRIIEEKEREIKRIELQNSQLRQQETIQTQFTIQSLKKLTPTSMYFFLIILMALVAMS